MFSNENEYKKKMNTQIVITNKRIRDLNNYLQSLTNEDRKVLFIKIY